LSHEAGHRPEVLLVLSLPKFLWLCLLIRPLLPSPPLLLLLPRCMLPPALLLKAVLPPCLLLLLPPPLPPPMPPHRVVLPLPQPKALRHRARSHRYRQCYWWYHGSCKWCRCIACYCFYRCHVPIFPVPTGEIRF